MTKPTRKDDEFTEAEVDAIIEQIGIDLDAKETKETFTLPWASKRYNNYDWVTERIAVGDNEYLTNHKVLARMTEDGVTHVLDCRIEANVDEKWYRGLLPDAKTRFVYLNNGCDDDLRRKSNAYFKRSILFCLDALSTPGAKVYIHCAAGYNRAPSNAYAVLLAMGMTAHEAETAITSVRDVGLAYLNDASRAAYELGYVSNRIPVSPKYGACLFRKGK